ncbi:MAG: glycosyltransferase family 2 protein [Pseudomonadota bacterium]
MTLSPDAPHATLPSTVSAIIVSYNTGAVLADALQALRTQIGLNEIILIDNGNPAGAVESAVERAIAASAPSEIDTGPSIRVLSGHGNIGFAAACNKGAAAVRADQGDAYLLFINPDALAPEGLVAALKADAAALSRPSLIAPKLVNPSGLEQQGSRRARLTPWRAIVEATKLYRIAPGHAWLSRFNRHEEPCPSTLTQLDVISGACFFLAKADYDAVGGMDEGYFLHVEDVDFCERFAAAGGSIWFDPAIAVVHHKSSSAVSPLKVEWWKTKSLSRYFRKHFADQSPPGSLFLLNAGLFSAFAARAAATALRRGSTRPST